MAKPSYHVTTGRNKRKDGLLRGVNDGCFGTTFLGLRVSRGYVLRPENYPSDQVTGTEAPVEMIISSHVIAVSISADSSPPLLKILAGTIILAYCP
jgi:hypothetical protein